MINAGREIEKREKEDLATSLDRIQGKDTVQNRDNIFDLVTETTSCHFS